VNALWVESLERETELLMMMMMVMMTIAQLFLFIFPEKKNPNHLRVTYRKRATRETKAKKKFRNGNNISSI
jgi:hypothetical protein